MIKVIYSKKSGKCDIGRINDKGDIFKEVRKMRYWTPVLMIKVIYSKKSGKCELRINDGYIQRSQENAILDVLMIKVIYSKKSGKCDIGRLY